MIFVSAPPAPAPSPAPAPIARTYANYEKPSRLTKFYRGCYKVLRLFPFIIFGLYSLIFILFGMAFFLIEKISLIYCSLFWALLFRLLLRY